MLMQYPFDNGNEFYDGTKHHVALKRLFNVKENIYYLEYTDYTLNKEMFTMLVEVNGVFYKMPLLDYSTLGLYLKKYILIQRPTSIISGEIKLGDFISIESLLAGTQVQAAPVPPAPPTPPNDPNNPTSTIEEFKVRTAASTGARESGIFDMDNNDLSINTELFVVYDSSSRKLLNVFKWCDGRDLKTSWEVVFSSCGIETDGNALLSCFSVYSKIREIDSSKIHSETKEIIYADRKYNCTVHFIPSHMASLHPLIRETEMLFTYPTKTNPNMAYIMYKAVNGYSETKFCKYVNGQFVPVTPNNTKRM